MFNIGGICLPRTTPADVYASSTAVEAGNAAQAAQERVRGLEDRVEKLALVCQAMWTLLEEKIGLKDEDLMARVKFIDLLDGVDDGKRTKHLAQCPKCHRTMSPRHLRCLYCGYEPVEQTAFDKLT